MENKIQSHELIAAYQFPNSFTALSGYVVDPNSDCWILDKDITIYLDFLNHIKVEISDFIRATLMDRAKKYMAGTIRNEFFALKDLLRKSKTIDGDIFFGWTLSAKSSLYPIIVRSFILYGHSLGISGINKDFIEELKEYSLNTRRRVTLKPVEENNIFEGSFSDLELENIIAKSLSCYMNGLMTFEQYSALMFFAQTGRRGIQASDLKIKDLQESKKREGICAYYVNVPRRKQRGQKFRESFNKVLIDQDLWLLLQLLLTEVVQGVLDNIKDADQEILSNLPLFPNKKLYEITDKQILIDKLNGDFLHTRAINLSNLVTSASEILNITSERTGEQLKITPKRFRHTIGTNSAREGYGARVIAEILDHTTDVVADIYTKNTPDIVERLDRALAMQLAPLAQAFTGVLIRDESEAKRGNDPTSRISNEKSNLGSCGSYGFCSASAPLACYTCQQFQPWLHAPHEEVLNHLLKERERVQDVTGDIRIASVNDRLIFAVTEVIQRCDRQNAFNRESKDV